MKRRELAWCGVALSATLVAVGFAIMYYIMVFSDAGVGLRVEIVCFASINILLLYGNIVYQLSRVGALKREAAHKVVDSKTLECIHHEESPRLAILIPSYCEEPHVLRQTMLSAALVEYPEREVVVLIDDPPLDHASRAASWRVVREITELLQQPTQMLQSELNAYHRRKVTNSCDSRVETINLASIYKKFAAWLELLAEDFDRQHVSKFAHVDAFFIDRILLGPAKAHRSRADTILASPLACAEVDAEYRRLRSLIAAEVSGFERKQFVNLSHAANKAMNLNAYIGLIGKCFRKVNHLDSTILVESTEQDADLKIASADFLVTLDADSVVMSDYALKLMHVMQSDDRIAVAQTPYCAFPAAPTKLERAAGATTDIQHIAHQGSTSFNAAYWVGANALLRVSALQDIKRETHERGHTMPVFIQDRTVIEDTGSTIDLISRGWRLYNFPERLAYSATPPDFGALIIQRRRWSNGGLIILADFIRSCRLSRRYRPKPLEAFVRIHYLVSPTIWSAAALAFLIYPFNSLVSAIWVPLIAAPYFYLYGRDLVRVGYEWNDLWRVYALNLLLIPVVLAGVLASLSQAITGRKASFGRTPKIEERTAIPAPYTGFNIAMLVVAVAGVARAMWFGNYTMAAFPVLNACCYVYGITHMMGRAALGDAKRSFRKLFPASVAGRAMEASAWH
jgi:cellulose synthase/poly-beta-1,6-N-acetylglucosamine synthase-like glycosyltransferase